MTTPAALESVVMQSVVFDFVLATLLPIYLITGLGYVLRSRGFLSTDFLRDSSRLVFNYAAPATLFFALAGSSKSIVIAPYFLLVSISLLIGLTLVCWILAPLVVKQRSLRGVFVQGASRGNLLVSGLAFTHGIYGMEGIALASLPLGIYIIFNNIYSVAILKYYEGDGGESLGKYWADVFKNPVIVAVLAGAFLGWLQVDIPDGVKNTGNLLSQLTVPLILFNVGASFDFKLLRSPNIIGWAATLYKCIIMPVIGVAIAWAMGIHGMELGIIFLLLSSPTSSISVVFAQMFGGHQSQAANMVLTSSLLSVVTVVVGLAFLQARGMI
ncbi:MAG: AEC family transporter [Porticoccaceae bacterium]|nr:AEC family transporter [Porticoccaceae bacterium]